MDEKRIQKLPLGSLPVLGLFRHPQNTSGSSKLMYLNVFFMNWVFNNCKVVTFNFIGVLVK